MICSSPKANCLFKYTVPYQWGSVGIAVNTTKVTKPITKFADLWDPAFKDKLVVLDDDREPHAYQAEAIHAWLAADRWGSIAPLACPPTRSRKATSSRMWATRPRYGTRSGRK